jgi:acyl-CoA synthetase (AMP-forming)/AMP-acid ligase II
MITFDKLHNQKTGFYDGVNYKNNVVCLLKDNAKNKPDKIALQWTDPAFKGEWDNNTPIENIPNQSINFKNFYDVIARTATGLKKAGVKHGDCVILFLPMSLYLYQAMSAIMMIGARAVFLDSWARRDQLGVSAKVVNPTAMISFEMAFQLCAAVPELNEIPIKIIAGPHADTAKYTATLEEISKSAPLKDIEAVEGEETALVTFTTGSSGVPKGANRTHRFLVAQHLALDECIPYNASDIDVPAFPIFSLNNIAAGVNTVIPITDIGRPGEKDPVMLVSQVRSCGITCATLSPSMIVNIAKFCDDNKITMPKIRRVITGGAPISNDTLELFRKAVPNAEVWVLYGSTEVEPIAHIEAKDILFPKHGGKAGVDGVNVGHFAEGLEYKLLKINKNPVTLVNNSWDGLVVGAGEVGELAVAGLHVCKSYYNNTDAVAKTKIIEADGKVWHRTGDLARIDDEKNVWLVGRVHNAISRDGQLLFPVKVEILLKKHPDVKQSAYVGIPDDKLGERAYALVMLVDEPKESKEEILSKLAEILKNENVPYDKLDITANVPMDPRHHSKVEYDVLREAILKEEAENPCSCCEECSYTSEGLAEEEKSCCSPRDANENDACNESVKSFLKIGFIILIGYILIKMLFGGKDNK